MEYNFGEIEQKWQAYWAEKQTYKVTEDSSKPKYYVLDMFPYPSGAGLHVGHPLGYIASDIFSRYKRLQGFNVLHPMGYDAYGLPAEQYAIQTGQHPAITTEKNIARYREQLDKIGFSYDWSREIRTSDPNYYQWTQWAFTQMFKSYYDTQLQRAKPIARLEGHFRMRGTENVHAATSQPIEFSAEEWNLKSDKEQQEILMNYRIAYLGDSMVNWCPQLGTVLANDEVSEGLSVRGGYPVEQKKMRQWCLRVSAYAERLLQGLDELDWSDSLKDTQRNWIGRSEGAVIHIPMMERQGDNSSNEFGQDAHNSEAEQLLWNELKNNQLGFEVKRQYKVGDFVAPFVNLEKGVIVIIETEDFLSPEQKNEQVVAQSKLKLGGFRIQSFTQSQVLADLAAVAFTIKEYVELVPVANIPLNKEIGDDVISVFTTRPDTIFGVTFMVLAPESDLVETLTTKEQYDAVQAYITQTKKKSELERISDKKVSGVFSGSYAKHPFTEEPLPIWISDYVLAGYGTGAIMAVPAHDSRDYAFARHFDLPIIPLIEGCDVSEESFDAKEGIMINSDFLNGLTVQESIVRAIQEINNRELGYSKVNFRIRDATFSRQRYWGEPFPIYYKDGMPYPLGDAELPLELPPVDKFLPTESGEPPLARAENWVSDEGYPLETSTMPGFAGSSAYYLRYMDPHNKQALVSQESNQYWRNVDLYIGGTEHATGHLVYSRFWNKFLVDLGVSCEEEPFKKLVNQGMIQGRSNFVYRIKNTNTFVSLNLKDQHDTTPIHVDVNIVHHDVLDIDAFKNWNPEYNNAEFILEDGKYVCGWAVEKMSKSMYNVVNPDDIVDKYGADTLRLYEMFLGPLEQSKPWDTNGIDGVHRFLRKVWTLFHTNDTFLVSEDEPTLVEYKALHKLIQKISYDIEHFSFNTSVSAFMICVNELTSIKCNKRAILTDFLVLLSPFAPHISEELWRELGNSETIFDAEWPTFNESYLKEDTFNYAISFNGKSRYLLEFPADATNPEIEEAVLNHPNSEKWMDGKTPKKVIIVPRKIVNIVL
ncbi:MAG: leucine--tRNA ligase [Candidatus Saccharimonadaceae bacterium]